MCGVAGITGISDPKIRELLVWGLGDGVDRRGGHAAGYATVDSDGRVLVNRKQGKWGERRAWRFIRQAAKGETVMLHARFATCGALTPTNAHPFTIKRDGKTVLHGMHNGMIYNARESARRNKRDFTVDSKELFELLADERYEEIGKLEGYGVIVWVRPEDPHRVLFCKLTSDADLVVASVKSGGIAWASTHSILENGLAAGMQEIDGTFDIQHGVVHSIADGKVWVHEEFKLALSSGYTGGYFRVGGINWADWEDEEWGTADKLDDDEELALLIEEDDLRKEELISTYGLDPDDVADFTASELQKFIDDWGMRSARPF